MNVYFFDSSAVVKRHVSEAGTAWANAIANPATGNYVYVAVITGVEVVSAITRRARGGSLSATEASTAIADFRLDLATSYLTPTLITKAMQLAETHALRGYDAVQLAAAMDVNTHWLHLGMPALTLVSADADLNASALTEGLAVEDPNDHP